MIHIISLAADGLRCDLMMMKNTAVSTQMHFTSHYTFSHTLVFAKNTKEKSFLFKIGILSKKKKRATGGMSSVESPSSLLQPFHFLLYYFTN